MPNRSFIPGACVLALACVQTAAESDARAEVVEARTGRVELRRAYTRHLELPSAECVPADFSCSVDQVYGQVDSLARRNCRESAITRETEN